ncbi:hypothetical protein BD410DRAFT_808578 [Rickenella mellea]|uniref:Uncharacterized protein n=1 Tax=Rickenella mellea TaxID=50990 RepID=A0A4Y7PLW8_9AGAM|nr:hypothetical protein BD410DRAFT_808578 [Rickenella mellea]
MGGGVVGSKDGKSDFPDEQHQDDGDKATVWTDAGTGARARRARSSNSLAPFAGALQRRDHNDRGVIETQDGPRPTSTSTSHKRPPMGTAHHPRRTTAHAQRAWHDPRPTAATNAEGGVRARGRTQSSSSGFALLLLGSGAAIDAIAASSLTPSNHHLPTSPSPKKPTKRAPPHKTPAVRRVRVRSPTETALPGQCSQVRRGLATTRHATLTTGPQREHGHDPSATAAALFAGALRRHDRNDRGVIGEFFI